MFVCVIKLPSHSFGKLSSTRSSDPFYFLFSWVIDGCKLIFALLGVGSNERVMCIWEYI